MNGNHWARLLAYVTGLVNQELLLQNEYLAAENRVLRGRLPARLLWFAIIPSARKRFTVRRMKGNNGDTCRRYFYRSFGSFGFC